MNTLFYSCRGGSWDGVEYKFILFPGTNEDFQVWRLDKRLGVGCEFLNSGLSRTINETYERYVELSIPQIHGIRSVEEFMNHPEILILTNKKKFHRKLRIVVRAK